MYAPQILPVQNNLILKQDNVFNKIPGAEFCGANIQMIPTEVRVYLLVCSTKDGF